MKQKTDPKRGAPDRCYHLRSPTASTLPLMITAWWPMRGCCHQFTLAHHLGLGELVDCHVDLGDAPGRANAGDKMMTLVASALAGGDCIDDADVLRTWGNRLHPGRHGQGAIHPGDVPAQFPVGHVRQLDRVSRELLTRAWAAGAGPGGAPLTIDLDSTICETYPLTGVFTRRLALLTA